MRPSYTRGSSGLPMAFTQDGLAFETGTGHARLPVGDVADALWQTLDWAVSHPSECLAQYHDDIAAIRTKVASLPGAAHEERLRDKVQGVDGEAQPMNRFYIGLVVLAVVVAIGLPTAGWLYEVFDPSTAFYLDVFAIVLPFLLVSLYVLAHWREVHLAVSIPVIVIILGLYAMTIRNLVIAGGNVFGG